MVLNNQDEVHLRKMGLSKLYFFHPTFIDARIASGGRFKLQLCYLDILFWSFYKKNECS